MARRKTVLRDCTPPEVDGDECTGCGLCAETCPALVFDMDESKAVVSRGDWCIDCGHCAAVCPVDAITQPACTPIPQAEEPSVSPDDLLMLLRERRSVRSYKKEPVPRETLDRIITAGRYAPTGSNSQNVNYVVLTTPAEIDELRGMAFAFYEKLFARVESKLGALIVTAVAGRKVVEQLREYVPLVEYAKELTERGQDRLFFHAPALFVVHADYSDTCSAFNCAVAIYNCSLMAHTLGVGCCFNGFLENAVNNDRRIKDWLRIPAENKCFGAMTLGFQDVRFRRLVERKAPDVTWR